jgi:hypothetical protein
MLPDFPGVISYKPVSGPYALSASAWRTIQVEFRFLSKESRSACRIRPQVVSGREEQRTSPSPAATAIEFGPSFLPYRRKTKAAKDEKTSTAEPTKQEAVKADEATAH